MTIRPTVASGNINGNLPSQASSRQSADSTSDNSGDTPKIAKKKGQVSKPNDDKPSAQAQGNATIKKAVTDTDSRKLSTSNIVAGVVNDWGKKGATAESPKEDGSKTSSNASTGSVPTGFNSANQSVLSMGTKQLQNTLATDDNSKLLGNPGKVPSASDSIGASSLQSNSGTTSNGPSGSNNYTDNSFNVNSNNVGSFNGTGNVIGGNSVLEQGSDMKQGLYKDPKEDLPDDGV